MDLTLGSILWKSLNCLNASAYIGIVADNMPQFMSTVLPSYDGHFHQENAVSQSSRLVHETQQ